MIRKYKFFKRNLPTGVFFERVLHILSEKFTDHRKEASDIANAGQLNVNAPGLGPHFLQDIAIETEDSPVNNYLAYMYLEHRYNLLGSGWLKHDYHSTSPGLGGQRFDNRLQIEEFDAPGEWLHQIVLPEHVTLAQSIWVQVSPGYEPIDWQKDVKTGFRWTARAWYKRQFGRSIREEGVDIKNPWELTRFQHLCHVALLAHQLPEKRRRLVLEFKDQILDFLATNPVGMGVNWTSTMDVAIRAANLLLAFDLIQSADSDGLLDEDFQVMFANSIYRHGKHIVENLEYKQGFNNNHYLSNIAGLVFVSTYLDGNEEINTWLAFAVQELADVVDQQFFEDGANFECSVPYHSLSTEMVVYATALILGLRDQKRSALRSYQPRLWKFDPKLKPLNQQSFDPDRDHILPASFFRKIAGAAAMIELLTKPSGEIPQFGDNDSGRFVRFSPVGSFLTLDEACEKYSDLANYAGFHKDSNRYWDENELMKSSVLAACEGLYDEFSSNKFNLQHYPERAIVQALKRQKPVPFDPPELKLTPHAGPDPGDTIANTFKHRKISLFKRQQEGRSLKEGLQLYVWKELGCYLLVSDVLYLVIWAATPKDQMYSLGHVHNDKLSIELAMDGKDLLKDPGSYLYTPFPEVRNQYRSVQAHSTVIFEGDEQNHWKEGHSGLFHMLPECKCRLIYASSDRIILRNEYRQFKHVREVIVEEDHVKICDHANHPFALNFNEGKLYSNGYGKMVNTGPV